MSNKQPLIGMPLLVGNLYLAHACGDMRYAAELLADMHQRDLSYVAQVLREMTVAVVGELEARHNEQDQVL